MTAPAANAPAAARPDERDEAPETDDGTEIVHAFARLLGTDAQLTRKLFRALGAIEVGR